jgi:alpha-galactosidase
LGGRPSGDLLAAWKAAREVRPSEGDQKEHTVTHSDAGSGLVVRSEVTEFADFPALEWVLHLRGDGSADTPIVSDLMPLDVAFPVAAGDPVLHYARGAVCSLDDFRPETRYVNVGAKQRLQPGGGRSSSDFLPFANLELGNGTGVVLGIGWSGEWALEVSRPEPGLVRLRAGMALTHLKLHPGEEMRTPRILLLFYRDGWRNGQNLLRQHLLAHHRPRVHGKPLEPLALNGNWGGTSTEHHLQNIAALREHDLPADYYWIDAEWFGTGPWFMNPGDWRPKADLYPGGFWPISDVLHKDGRKLLLWFEPERVCQGTPWAKEHPAWLLEVPEGRRFHNWGTSQQEPDWIAWESRRNQIRDGDRLFNLAIPEACRFLTDFVSSRIEEYGLDCFRHDANISPLEFWRAADAPDRQGITEIRWVEGLYAFWDELLHRYPRLVIDNCASGGRRIDLESISRSIPLWRTDYPGSPIGRQCHTYGLSQWVPLNGTGGITLGREGSYSVRSAYTSSLCFGLFGVGDAPQPGPPPSDFPFDQARAQLKEYRRVHPYFLGDYYPLSQYSQATDAWIAWQFHRSDLNEGMVQAFRRQGSPHQMALYPLHALDREATYSIANLDGGDAQKASGAKLLDEGLTLNLPDRPSACIVLYRKV